MGSLFLNLLLNLMDLHPLAGMGSPLLAHRGTFQNLDQVLLKEEYVSTRQKQVLRAPLLYQRLILWALWFLPLLCLRFNLNNKTIINKLVVSVCLCYPLVRRRQLPNMWYLDSL